MWVMVYLCIPTVAVEYQTSVQNSLQGSVLCTIPQESGAAGVQLYSLFVTFLYSML